MVTAYGGEAGVENTFNAEGYRASKTVDGETTWYAYEYDKIIKEVDSQGNASYNIYGTGLISRETGGEKVYYLYNGHGDVTALVNTGGVVVMSYYYDAFGNVLEAEGAYVNSFLYSGYVYDRESELYNLNARFYDAVTARFMQEDSYLGSKEDPLSLNRYAYVNNNPLRYWDPTGHSAVQVTLPNGQTVTADVKDGITKMPDGSRPPEGAVVHTAGGDYKMVGGKGEKVEAGSSSPSKPSTPSGTTGPSGPTKTVVDIILIDGTSTKGYMVDGKTYTDAECRTRIPVGTIVKSSGTYYRYDGTKGNVISPAEAAIQVRGDYVVAPMPKSEPKIITPAAGSGGKASDKPISGNPSVPKTPLKENADGYVYPVQLSKLFNVSKEGNEKTGYFYHDISVPRNTEYYAITDGTVTYKTHIYKLSGKDTYISYGLSATFVSSDGRIEVRFAHLESAPGIHAGENIPDLNSAWISSSDVSITPKTISEKSVSKGDVIGFAGDRGRADGVHLHIEVRIDGQRVDPTVLFPDYNP